MADLAAYNEMMRRCRACGAEDRASISGFTPSLPDELFLSCVVRVPLQYHANLQQVSPRLRKLVQSPEYFKQRKSEGASSDFVCMLQSHPASSPEKSSAGDSVFGVTLLDVATGVWQRLPPVPGLPAGLPTFAQLVAVNRKLVVMGGWWQTTWEPSRFVFVYNFTTQRWSQGMDMPRNRSFFACGELQNRVIVAGGHDGDKKALKSVDCYDPETNSWSSLTPMREERDEPTGGTVDGRFFVVSGYGSEFQGGFTKSAEVYDPMTKSWSFVEEMWTPAEAYVTANPSSLAALNGEFYAVHGKEIVVYSRQNNAWSVVAKLPEEYEKGEMTSTCISAAGDALVITGLVRRNEVASLRTLKLTPGNGARKAQWETVPCNEQFLNLAQTACSFEL